MDVKHVCQDRLNHHNVQSRASASRAYFRVIFQSRSAPQPHETKRREPCCLRLNYITGVSLYPICLLETIPPLSPSHLFKYAVDSRNSTSSTTEPENLCTVSYAIQPSERRHIATPALQSTQPSLRPSRIPSILK